MGMLTARERQKREIETIREKNIKVELSVADCDRLTILCGKHGLTVGELFAQFAGDLVCGTYSNGSDECYMARTWFDRCGFGMCQKETLLMFLLKSGYDVEEFLYLLDNIESAEADLGDYQNNPEKFDEEEIEYAKVDLEDWKEEYHDFIEEYMGKYPEADLAEEIRAVREWFYDKEALRNE